MLLELNVKVIIYKLYTSRHYDILYQNLITMYIGNLCDSGRFHSMGFLEKLFIKIFLIFIQCVCSEIKFFLFLFLFLFLE